MQEQMKNHPDELWEDGVRDYLTHASNIMVILNKFYFIQKVFFGVFFSLQSVFVRKYGYLYIR